MNSTMPDRRTPGTPTRARAAQWCIAAALLLTLVACGGKTPAQVAEEELNAGLAASSQGQADQAATHFRACVAADSLNKTCIYNLGVLAQQAKHAAEAENDYRLALLIDPQFPGALFNLAILRAEAGSIDEAIALNRAYITIKPENAFAHLNLGLLLRASGHVKEGEAELATARSLDPTVVIPPFEGSPSPTPGESSTASESASVTPSPSK